MQDMLGEAYPAFRQSYEKNKFQALRVNPMKGTQEAFLQSAPFTMRKVPWAENGFYYSEQDQPGKHPWHEAGVYYIQEPSAMAPAAYLEAKPGEKARLLVARPRRLQLPCRDRGFWYVMRYILQEPRSWQRT